MMIPMMNLVTIDEQLFPYRGRTRFTRYIPSKPAKYGIKLFWICDSKTYFPLKGIIYTGLNPNTTSNTTNVGEKVVIKLVKNFKNSGQNVTMNNCFISLKLANMLRIMKFTLVGTMRQNKSCTSKQLKPTPSEAIGSVK